MWKMGLYLGILDMRQGQSCVGGSFQLVTENFSPGVLRKAANEQGIHIYEYLNKLAAKKKREKRDFWHWTGGMETEVCWWMEACPE